MDGINNHNQNMGGLYFVRTCDHQFSGKQLQSMGYIFLKVNVSVWVVGSAM